MPKRQISKGFEQTFLLKRYANSWEVHETIKAGNCLQHTKHEGQTSSHSLPPLFNHGESIVYFSFSKKFDKIFYKILQSRGQLEGLDEVQLRGFIVEQINSKSTDYWMVFNLEGSFCPVQHFQSTPLFSTVCLKTQKYGYQSSKWPELGGGSWADQRIRDFQVLCGLKESERK